MHIVHKDVCCFLGQPMFLISPVGDASLGRRTMHVVFEDCRLVDCWEIAAHKTLAPRAQKRTGQCQKPGRMENSPSSKDIQQRSLATSTVAPECVVWLSVNRPCRGECNTLWRPPGASTHSSTSLRWTVLLPPSPQGMISDRSGKRWRVRGRLREVRGVRARRGKVREKRRRRDRDSIVDESSEKSIGGWWYGGQARRQDRSRAGQDRAGQGEARQE